MRERPPVFIIFGQRLKPFLSAGFPVMAAMAVLEVSLPQWVPHNPDWVPKNEIASQGEDSGCRPWMISMPRDREAGGFKRYSMPKTEPT